MSDLTPADPYGTTGVTTVSGRRADGCYYVGVFPYPGGYGASAVSDGLVNGTLPSSLAAERVYNVRVEPVEWIGARRRYRVARAASER